MSYPVNPTLKIGKNLRQTDNAYRKHNPILVCICSCWANIKLHEKKRTAQSAFFVAYDVLLSNKFLKDLDRLWAMRPWIPDPTDPTTWK